MNTIKIKFNIQLVIVFIMGVLIGGGIIFLINQQNIKNEQKVEEIASISKEEAGERVINIINERTGRTASLIEIISERGLYKITVNIERIEEGVEQEVVTVYLTKDGVLLLSQVIEKQPEFTQEQLGALAKCLTEKGVQFFGTHWCPFCTQQKEMFGETARYLPYIECAPDRATSEEIAMCEAANVRGVPHWRFPDQRQIERIMSIQSLIEYSGCVI